MTCVLKDEIPLNPAMYAGASAGSTLNTGAGKRHKSRKGVKTQLQFHEKKNFSMTKKEAPQSDSDESDGESSSSSCSESESDNDCESSCSSSSCSDA